MLTKVLKGNNNHLDHHIFSKIALKTSYELVFVKDIKWKRIQVVKDNKAQYSILITHTEEIIKFINILSSKKTHILHPNPRAYHNNIQYLEKKW